MENLSSTEKVYAKTSNSFGKALIALSAGAAVGISIVCWPFVSPAFRRFTLPFIPATDNQIKNILSILPKNAEQKKLLDIGSGNFIIYSGNRTDVLKVFKSLQATVEL
jgi:hypothetical protein